MDVPVLVLTGPVGVGKTAVAVAISDELRRAGMAHAIVDLDALRQGFPSPPDDPFNMVLGLRNLAAVWANYRGAGAERLVVADVVETRVQRATYAEAVPGAVLCVVRLTATLPTILRRLEGREVGESLAWHQRRAAELEAMMAAAMIEDMCVDTEGKTTGAIAWEILDALGWIESEGFQQT